MSYSLEDVFKFYNKYTKLIYHEIEARDNSIPIELLFEIHACFDHIKRIYIEKQDKNNCCEKAISHLKRGTFDAFKLKLKNFNDDYSQLIKKPIAFHLLDNGEYERNLINDKNKIISLATEARQKEGEIRKHKEIIDTEIPVIDDIFSKWMSVSNLISQFYEEYFDDKKINWGLKETKRIKSKFFIIGFISGFFSSIIAGFILQIFNIKDFFINIWNKSKQK